MNEELARICQQDQEDRKGGLHPDLRERDRTRRQRVTELIDEGVLQTPEDYFHAALVFQHGEKLEDYWRAHELAKKAAELGHSGGRWLTAAAYDRWLMNQGKPQKYGTQYTARGDEPYRLWDVDPTTTVISHYLQSGGTFYMLEGHPFMWTLDEFSPDLKVIYPYSSSGPLTFEAEYSYADPTIKLANKTEYGWNHSFSDILNPLIAEGLTIEFLHEFPFSGWKCLPDMEEGEDGWCRFQDEKKRNLVPLMFSLKATKR